MEAKLKEFKVCSTDALLPDIKKYNNKIARAHKKSMGADKIAMDIDLNDLEVILSKHPFDFQHDTEKLPELKRKKLQAKLAVDRVRAELYLEIREELLSSGEKFTEKTLEAKVVTSIKYIKICEQYLQTQEEYDNIENIKDQYLQRDAALKSLVALFGAQYWSIK